jgi:hypothetical protein
MFTWIITYTDNEKTFKVSVNRNSIDEALEWANKQTNGLWIVSIVRKKD